MALLAVLPTACLMVWLCIANAAALPDKNTTWLNQWPFLMTHDSATGYLHLKDPVTRYAKTQSCDLSCQLDCGARAFDLRPALKGNNLVLHHGDVIVHHDFTAAMGEILSWAGRHPQELVLPYISHCDGDGCEDAAKQALKNIGVFYMDQCSQLVNLTVARAEQLAKHTTGGLVFVLFDCVDEQYDPSIECYGNDKVHFYTCYSNKTKDIPFSKLWNYLSKVTGEKHHTEDGMLWMAQAHWQYSAESVSIGLEHDSSILLDEAKSQVNQQLVGNITRKNLPYINLLEVDNICDHGADLLAALENMQFSSGH